MDAASGMGSLSRTLLAALILGCGACTTGATDDDHPLYEEPSSSEDAIEVNDVSDYVAIAPPEHLVTTARASALVGKAIEPGRRLTAIRRVVLRGKQAKLLVDEKTMTTAVVADSVLASASRAATAQDGAEATPYAASLAALARNGGALESIDADAHLEAQEPFTLTIDMCQSRREWDKSLYEWAVDLSAQLGKPVPVGIAMTGGWARAHAEELARIVQWEREGKLAVTWINHSNTHPLHCLDASCARAEFLTAASVDFDDEVLGLERTLLARDILPSVLFRFPGLIHDARRLQQLTRLSLMPLDADSWIAKGQGIKPRGVVLVHGNGNEPPGITGFLSQARTRADALRSGKSVLVSPLLVAPTPPR